MAERAEPRLGGWLVLALAATVLALVGALAVVWAVLHGDFGGVLFLPFVLGFWGWVARFALRRREDTHSPGTPNPESRAWNSSDPAT